MKASNQRNTAWLAKGSFGVMVHYLPIPAGKSAAERSRAFNQTVEGFQVNQFVADFLRTGADWLIFTLGQNTGYYCSPNAWLDARLPGRTSRRDLAGELACRLQAHRKRFIAYLPADLDLQDNEIKRAFAWSPDYPVACQRHYELFLRSFSKALADRADGWWFDGCWVKPARFGDWRLWMAAARAGNPEALVAVSPGPADHPLTPGQDYLAGETYELPPPSLPTGRFVDGVQWHALLPIYSTFTTGPSHVYDDDLLVRWVRRCKAVGGAVTLNVPVSDEGMIPDEPLSQLRRLGAALMRRQQAVPPTPDREIA